MKYTKLLLSAFFLVYVFFAFVLFDLNAGAWPWDARCWCVGVTLIVWLIACAGDKE